MPKYFLKFPPDILGEPIFYNLGKEFHVVPNIRGATITKEQALMAVELEGEGPEVLKAVAWLRAKGVEARELDDDEEAASLLNS